MIEHPRARNHITLNEFIYIQGKRAVLGGLLHQVRYYEEKEDEDSLREVQEEYTVVINELLDFKLAVERSDRYHRGRKDGR